MNIAILIPTKNRSEFVERLLAELKKYNETIGIAIYVIDASDDTKTLKLLESNKNTLSVNYIKSLGKTIDDDLFYALDIIDNQYVWFLGDDDGIYPQSINEVIKQISINKNAVGFTFNYQAYDKNLEKKFFTPSASQHKYTESFQDTSTLIECCGAHLGFISCQVINNHEWKKIKNLDGFDKKFNNWSIPYLILNTLQYGSGNWVYCNKKIIKYRTGNDSFLERGLYWRQKLMFEGFFSLIKRYSTDQSYIIFKKRYFWSRLIRNAIAIKYKGTHISDQMKILKLFKENFGFIASFWFLIIPIFILPRFFYKFLISLLNRNI